MRPDVLQPTTPPCSRLGRCDTRGCSRCAWRSHRQEARSSSKQSIITSCPRHGKKCGLGCKYRASPGEGAGHIAEAAGTAASAAASGAATSVGSNPLVVLQPQPQVRCRRGSDPSTAQACSRAPAFLLAPCPKSSHFDLDAPCVCRIAPRHSAESRSARSRLPARRAVHVASVAQTGPAIRLARQVQR